MSNQQAVIDEVEREYKKVLIAQAKQKKLVRLGESIKLFNDSVLVPLLMALGGITAILAMILLVFMMVRLVL